MAVAAVAEARLCGNCKKDIPAVNFITHEIHCRRNIEICSFCQDSIPKCEMKNHIESEHVQVTCECRMKVENSLLKDHQASACPLRPVLCRFCDIQLPFNKLPEHELFCGARTELCRGCGRNVLLRDLREHPGSCGREDPPRGSRAGNLGSGGGRRDPPGAGEELEQLDRPEIPPSSLPEEWNAELDYVLALSLQDENSPPQNTADEIPGDFWEYDHPRETQWENTSWDSPGSFGTSNHRKSQSLVPRNSEEKSSQLLQGVPNRGSNVSFPDPEVTMLPCEFCEELCPAEELILHQTGCNPASAFASFSKSSSSPNPREHRDGVGSNSWRTLPSPQPQAGQAEGDIMIPCEFCGIQLEEEVLFHHQHYCDLRPASPARRDSRESPELRRRSRHQGDVPPRHTEGFGQPGPGGPSRGPRLRSDMANARNAQVPCPQRASDIPRARGKPRKGSGSEGRAKGRGAGEAAGGTTPRARPAQHFPGESFPSRCSGTSAAQPSPAGRSPGQQDGQGRRRSSKAKGQKPAAGSPEE